jgi:hypothetical protein
MLYLRWQALRLASCQLLALGSLAERQEIVLGVYAWAGTAGAGKAGMGHKPYINQHAQEAKTIKGPCTNELQQVFAQQVSGHPQTDTHCIPAPSPMTIHRPKPGPGAGPSSIPLTRKSKHAQPSQHRAAAHLLCVNVAKTSDQEHNARMLQHHFTAVGVNNRGWCKSRNFPATTTNAQRHVVKLHTYTQRLQQQPISP